MAEVEAHNAENMWKAIASGSRLLEVGSMFRIAQDCYLFGGKLFESVSCRQKVHLLKNIINGIKRI